MSGGPASVLTVLGSGTALPDARRHSAAFHLALPRAGVLFDCGPGTLHGLARHGIDWPGLTHIVVSHFHNDHVGDLAAIPFAMKQTAAPERNAPLHLLGPAGLRGFLDRLAAAMGPHVLDPGFPVITRELAPGDPYEDIGGGFVLEAHRTPHTDESVAYRIRCEEGVLGYTGDTGPSTEVAAFLRGCRVLVAECALPDPAPMDRHLTPRLVAQLAAVAEPDLLVLTHVYPPQTPAEAEARVSELYRGAVVAAMDGMRVRLGPDGPVVDPTPAEI